MPVAISKLSCLPCCGVNSSACRGQDRVKLQSLPLSSVTPAQALHGCSVTTFQAAGVELGCVSLHSWQPFSHHGLWGSLTSSSCSPHCSLSVPTLNPNPTPRISESLLPPPSQVGHNTHFPVTAPCGKGRERRKDGNKEDRHIIQEGFLEEIIPRPSLGMSKS